jgi:DNA invertase Pin-like site-specific DNA recombinase
MTKAKRVAIYVRVSTGEQTTTLQRRELTAWAERTGHIIAKVFEDKGISGAKGRDKRPGLDAMLNDASRRKFNVVMAWAIDRLGRSLIDVIYLIRLAK